jgi:CheY-like chemotaxis protein/HPt (histidine-containing phosphotransfer) domain-containing protein
MGRTPYASIGGIATRDMNDGSQSKAAPGGAASSGGAGGRSPSLVRVKRRLVLLVVTLVAGLTLPYVLSLPHDGAPGEARWEWLVAIGGGLLVLSAALLAIKNGVEPELDTLERERAELDVRHHGALRAAQETNEYLRDVTREIHASMHAVLGLTQLLLRSPLDATQHRQMRTIDGASRALLRIINDLLSLSGPDKGRFDFVPMGTSLHEVLFVSIDLLEPAAKDRGLTLQLNIALDVPDRVLIDIGRVQQIVLGICRYAIETCEPGRLLRVDAGASHLSDTHFDLLLRIASTIPERAGVSAAAALISLAPISAVPSSRAAKVPLHGVRVPSSPVSSSPVSSMPVSSSPVSSMPAPSAPISSAAATSVGPRAAAGLSLPRRLVALMGGSLELGEPKGTLMLVLPVPRIGYPGNGAHRAHTDPHLDAISSAPPPMLVRLPTASAPILLVEADATAQSAGVELLENLGFDVEIASSAGRAIERAAHKRFALILMATELPGMDGYGAAARILAQLGQQRPALLGYAHTPSPETRERAAAAGMDALLAAPLERASLCEALAEWLPDEANPASSGTRLSKSGALEQATRRAALARFSGAPASSLPDLTPGERPEGMMEVFVREVPIAVRTLARAAARGRRDEVASLAAPLKERCSNCGAMKMAALCRTLEGARDLSLEQLGANAKALGQSLDAVLALLVEKAERPPASATTERNPDSP